WRVERHRLAVHEQVAGVRLVDAGEDFRQGGLAGAVLAYEAVDAGRGDAYGGVDDPADAAEALGDLTRLQQWMPRRRRHVVRLRPPSSIAVLGLVSLLVEVCFRADRVLQLGCIEAQRHLLAIARRNRELSSLGAA